ncbi:MAG TPA: methyltransferase domain-containing protein [Methanocorpusculum sp.]|nr:methyltransferase domain-containing protein [Methanocorpusculum sp.]
MNLLFELSGENQALSIAEIGCVGTVCATGNGIAIARVEQPEKTARLAGTHVVSKLLGECDGTKEALEDLLKSLQLQAPKPFCARVNRIHPAAVNAASNELERMMGSLIKGEVSLKNPGCIYRAVFTAGKCYLGEVLQIIDRGAYAARSPQKRAYFHPGVMMPLMAREIINLTRVEPGETLLDPFCGTGGMLMECAEMGIAAVGSDFNEEMLAGCRMNNPNGLILRADAAHMPYPDASFDAVAADLPYGQSTIISAESLDTLYNESLAEIRRVLKPGRRAVIVTHKDIRDIAARYFTIADYIEQRVHKSLTRRILVLI